MDKRILLYITAFCIVTTVKAQETLHLSINDCRSMAVAHDEDLRCADNAVKQAEADKGVAMAAYLPKISSSVTGAYIAPNIDMMGMQLQMRGMYMAGITLTQPIYAGGRIRAGKRLAEIGCESSMENYRKTKMQVVADADIAYWSLIAVKWKVRMLRAYKAQMDTLYRQTQTGLDAGMATDNDLLRVQAKQSEINYQLNKAESGAELCNMSLCSVIGCSVDTRIVPTDTIITTQPPSGLSADITLRPELGLLGLQVKAAEHQVKMARAEILPTVGLSANYSYYGNIKLNGMTADAAGNAVPFTQNYKDDILVVMASVSIPVFNWGSGLKKIRKAKIEADNARLSLQKTERLLRLEVEQAITNLNNAHKLVSTACIGLKQAEANLRQERISYAAGLCPLSDLMDAHSQWLRAQSSLIEALTGYKIYETEYLKATGRLPLD